MGYRIPVDENTSPLVVELLQEAGHEAIHVSQALDFDATDVPVLHYADDTVEPATLAKRIGELSTFVPDSSDLPGVTNLGDWN